jgi:hypothetical protein
VGAKEQSGRTWSSLYLNSRDRPICKTVLKKIITKFIERVSVFSVALSEKIFLNFDPNSHQPLFEFSGRNFCPLGTLCQNFFADNNIWFGSRAESKEHGLINYKDTKP